MLFTNPFVELWLLRWWPKCRAPDARWPVDGEPGCILADNGGLCLCNEIELLGEYWSKLEFEPFEHKFVAEFVVGKLVSHCIVDWLFEIELLLIMDAGDGVENWRVEPLSGLPKQVWLRNERYEAKDKHYANTISFFL